MTTNPLIKENVIKKLKIFKLDFEFWMPENCLCHLCEGATHIWGSAGGLNHKLYQNQQQGDRDFKIWNLLYVCIILKCACLRRTHFES